MKKLLFVIPLLVFFNYLGFSQDTIVTETNSIILSKVLEITTTEVKYKKFDNIDGPSYSVLKSEISMIKFSNGTTEKFSHGDAALLDKATIYVFREGKYSGSAVKLKVYCNGEMICELPNNSGCALSITKPGKYDLNFSNTGCSDHEVSLEVDAEHNEQYIKYNIGGFGCSYSKVSTSIGKEEYQKIKKKFEVTIK